jgi:hypothetical protein
MTNAETPRTDTRNYESPFRMTRHGRALAAGATVIALLTGAGLAAESRNRNTAPVEHADSKPNSQTLMIDNLIEKGHDSPYIIGHINQDEIPSIVLQNSAAELNATDKKGTVTGQQFATLESANKLATDTEQHTGGAVYPGEEFITWRDSTTGLIISQAKFDK